ncbi:MAG TPA: nitronate monooxygenase [Clostridiales bacterium]|nr:nitronate monooxygenase [Clostridiales bacterium]
MEMKPLIIGDITVTIPIIQGGMGVGISRNKLASAVARQGGVGIISTAQIGYDEPEFAKKPLEANLKAINKHVKLAKENSNNGVIGVNIMVATKGYEMYVEAACKAGTDIIISGAGLPINLPELTKDYSVKIAPIVSSEKAAAVILRMWDKKHNRIPDFIVIEGPEAGGHLAFKKEELDNINDIDFDKEVKGVIKIKTQYEEKYNKKIPVIFAGGIFYKEDIKRVFLLGVDGVQIGSRFVTTVECDASDEFKQAYINANKDNITIAISPVGLPGRAINNAFIKRTKEGRISVNKCYKCLEKCNPATTPYCITAALINAVKGDVDNGLVFCGSRTYKLDKITTVKEIFDELKF